MRIEYLAYMGTLIQPKNIRIYRQSDGTYTTKPKGKYVSCLTEEDNLTSIEVGTHASPEEAIQYVQKYFGIAMLPDIPVYQILNSARIPEYDIVCEHAAVSIENFTYFGTYLCTVSIIGVKIKDEELCEKITYSDNLPQQHLPIHHQILTALDTFCKDSKQENMTHYDYSDNYGKFMVRFSRKENGIQVAFFTIGLKEEYRGNRFLVEIFEHLKLDERVCQISVETVGAEGLKLYLQKLGFQVMSEWRKNSFILNTGDEVNNI